MKQLQPEGLGAPGQAAWDAIWDKCAWLDEQDVGVVEQIARLEDETATYRAALAEHGPLLEEPIVSPRGDVVGTRLVANPAEAMLRRAERQLLDLRTALACTPISHARLGKNTAILRKMAKTDALKEQKQQAALEAACLILEEGE